MACGRARTVRRAALLAVIALAGGCAWPQFRGDAAHSGTSRDQSIALHTVPGLVPRWAVTTGGAVRSSPSDDDNTVFVGSSDGRVYAVDETKGTPHWSFATAGPVTAAPAVDKKLVFAASDDHHLYARHESDGSAAWTVLVSSSFAGADSAPTVVDGSVFVSDATTVYAYDEATGAPQWSRPLAVSSPLGAPAVDGGVVFVASYGDAAVFALDEATGAPAWTYQAVGARVACATERSSPAVVAGAAYVSLCPAAAAPNASLYAIDASAGSARWTAGSAPATNDVSVAAGVVYDVTTTGTVEARDAGTGNVQWSASLGAASATSPAVVNGVVYVGADNSKVAAFDATGRRGCAGTPVTCTPLWTATTGGPVRSSPAVTDGAVYVGSDDHRVYAFGLPPIAFNATTLTGTSSTSPIVSRFGPDGRLYVAQFDGLIKAYTVARSGIASYHVTATEVINAIQGITNHDDDGSVNSSVTTRLVTGMAVTGTASNPVLYVASSDPRIGAGPDGVQTNLDTNSGVISRLQWQSGQWQRTDLVRGLPRSQENHAPNVLTLDTATNMLYVGQGGNTNEGAPSHNFGFLPEYAYSAAVLRIDLNAIGNTTYDLPTLVNDNHPHLKGPFGGDAGNHQAKITVGSPVQVYAPGFRNPFAMVVTRAGHRFVIDNGQNAGWGDIPIGAGPQGTCTNGVNEPGTHDVDSLHLVDQAGYYGGHANPTRGNRANTFDPLNPQSPVPTANPIECDARDSSNNGNIATLPPATAGMAEYTSSALADQLDGDLLVAAQGLGAIYRVELDTNGTTVLSVDPLFSNLGGNPMDVAVQDDNGAFPGTIWVPGFTDNTIHVFEPADFGGQIPPPCSGTYSTTLDEDHDGYTNADEIDNGTDPCSAGDVPHDWNRNGISDRNDPDDDSDGIPDVSDPFPLDPSNGLSTHIPVAYSWQSGAPNQPCAPTPFPSGCPGGLLGLGFTGLMSNGTSYYSALYDPTNIIAGGAAGVFTVAAVPPGDATGSTNTQAYAFQYGIDANPADTGVFTVHARVVAPFAGTTPAGRQAIGMYLGTGGQDNYTKLVLDANHGAPRVSVVQEVAGATAWSAATPTTLPGPDAVDLYLTVDPTAATVSASYSTTTGGVTSARTTVGTPHTIPSSWLTSTTQGLAIGVIATSAGASPMPATWSLLEAYAGP